MLDIFNDTLFVASEDEGIVIYEIIDDNEVKLDSIFTSNIVGVPVTLDIAENSRTLIVLDDYNHNYIGSLDWDEIQSENMSAVSCDDYQRKAAFIDYPDKPSAKGYPNEPPPEIDPDTGMHPKYGKPYKYDKLDPVSAVAMRGAPTGNPEVDANVEKAAKKVKPKVKEDYSDWRKDVLY